MYSLLNVFINKACYRSMDMNLSKLREIVKDRGAWCAAIHGLQRVRYDLVTE